MEKYITENINIRDEGDKKLPWCITRHSNDDFTLHAGKPGFPHINMKKSQLLELYDVVRDTILDKED